MRAAALLIGLLVGCGDDGADPRPDAASDSGDGGTGPVFVGGDRPARVVIPAAHDGSTPLPLVVLLHGYGVDATVQEFYFGLRRRAQARGFFLVLPDGTPDDDGRLFWNALPAWPGAPAELADDVAYLSGIVDEMAARFGIDRGRVYFIGHSNGAFMAHRMACDADGLATAIVSLAGSSYADEADCRATSPTAVLSIHGDADDVIAYDGTPIFPGAIALAARWAGHNGCRSPPSTAPPIDFDSSIAGEETDVVAYNDGCSAAMDVALWTIHGGGHLPPLAPDAVDRLLDWLLPHQR